MVKKFSAAILKARWAVVIIFAVLTLVCMQLSAQVKTNYNLSDYLPDAANSTVGLRLMEEQFDTKPANLRILLYDVSIPQALDYKAKIEQIDGVKDVTWLDDSVNVYQPLDMIPQKTVDAWYKDGNALLTAYAASKALPQVRQIIGEDNAMAGDIVQTRESRLLVQQDVAKIVLLAVPLIFAILLITTTSLFEPVLFLATIGVAIMLGKGTDLMLGEVSFITGSCSSILQLAISMDYAIFLLEAFEENRNRGEETYEAMANAMVSAFSSILSSSVTTIMGFIVMVLMEFKVGFDLGLVLAKDIALSLIAVLVLLPCLAIICNKAIEKTHHRRWFPTFKVFGRVNARICVPVLLLCGALIVACFLGSARNDYVYGTTEMLVDPALAVVKEQREIDALYEKSNQMVLLVPGGQPAREQLMIDELNGIGAITSVTAYGSMADTTIPVDFVGRDAVKQLIGDRFDRMILTADIETESARAYKLVEDIRAVGEKYYPGNAYLTGGTANIYDLRDVVRRDDTLVNKLAIGSIGAVLVINFKSLLLPLILLATIKSSIYVNLAVPYFAGQPLYYIGSLIINAIQLGATVDYAILFTTNYLNARKKKGRLDAAAGAITQSTSAIVTSAGILLTAGLALGNSSSVDVVAQLGVLVGRGAGISAVLVLMMLPALLMIFDPLVRVTTLGTQFYKPERRRKRIEREKNERRTLDEEYRDFIRLADGDQPADGGGGDEE